MLGGGLLLLKLKEGVTFETSDFLGTRLAHALPVTHKALCVSMATCVKCLGHANEWVVLQAGCVDTCKRLTHRVERSWMFSFLKRYSFA